MFVSGCLQFRNKKEKLAAWKQLRQEFEEYGDRLKIVIKDNTITYQCNVSRNFF